LKEIPASTRAWRVERNVMDADGTLILSYVPLSGTSALAHKLAEAHVRPCLYVNLTDTNGFKAAEFIKSWLEDHEIEVLTVVGPDSNRDPRAYRSTKQILRTSIQLALIEEASVNPVYAAISGMPRTVGEAVDLLLAEISFRDRVRIAKMETADLASLDYFMGDSIRYGFGLGRGNADLLVSCRRVAREKDLHPDDAPAVIIKAMWDRLRQTHGLRVLKS